MRPAARTLSVTIRPEHPDETAAIGALTTAAFAGAPHSDGTEAAIVAALRRAGALTLSLVALEPGGEGTEAAIVGHVAFSPVTITPPAGHASDPSRTEPPGAWFGLGPLSVRPDRQGRGIGGALVRAGLERLEAAGAAGVVVLGDPGYYGRHGFVADPRLRYPGVPADYFQHCLLRGPATAGTVAYHPGFGATG